MSFTQTGRACLPLLLVFLSCPSASASDYDDYIEKVQPGRIDSAQRIIAQAKQFKLNAKQYHLDAKKSIEEAKKLKGKADALNGALDANAPKEYSASLKAFQDHAKLYRSHLEQVEKNYGYCKDTAAQYEASLKELSLHTERFHIPSIRPPHICGMMDLSAAESNHVANAMRADEIRVAQSEAALASSEAKLQNAINNSRHSSQAAGNRNRLQEEERNLAGEFAKLKTEYELLDLQHSALLGARGKLSGSTSNVKGEIKH